LRASGVVSHSAQKGHCTTKQAIRVRDPSRLKATHVSGQGAPARARRKKGRLSCGRGRSRSRASERDGLRSARSRHTGVEGATLWNRSVSPDGHRRTHPRKYRPGNDTARNSPRGGSV